MMIIWILPWDKDILIAHVVWPLIQDPKAPLHFCRITAAKKGMKVTCVSFTLIGSSLEVSVFVERNLSDKTQTLTVYNVLKPHGRLWDTDNQGERGTYTLSRHCQM